MLAIAHATSMRNQLVTTMGEAPPLICVVDDDESVRESLPDLLRELGFKAEAFSSAKEYLESETVSRTACLLLDVKMPGMAGPELQRELRQLGHTFPIIFITAHANPDVRPSISAQGGVECLLKPFSEDALVTALRSALSRVKTP